MIRVDRVIELIPFLALGILGFVTLGFTAGTLRSARRSEQLGEDRLDLLRDSHERLELLREERKTLLVELERERRERQEAQGRVKQLMREHPHLELEREIQRLTEELELEREGRLHNLRERQRLVEELEAERLAHSEDERAAQHFEREVRELEYLFEESQGSRKVRKKKGSWTALFGGGR
jgi:predicted nuclease with TOPRIM domain